MYFKEFKSLRAIPGFPKGASEKNDFDLFKSHDQFWSNYFLNIFLGNYNPSRLINLVFWESGPSIRQPAGTKPNGTYAFSDLKKPLSTSIYLKKVSRKADVFDPDVEDDNDHFYVGDNSTKEYTLRLLSKKNWLIIDLYPTHGHKITTNNRKRLTNGDKNIFTDYTKKHLASIFLRLNSDIKKRFKNDEILRIVKYNNKILYLNFLVDTIGSIIKEGPWFEGISNLAMKKIKWEGYC